MATPGSPEDICNIALLNAGLNQKIGDINETSAAAQACNIQYDLQRINLYSEFRWSFTVKRGILTPLSGAAYDAATTYAKGQYAQYGDVLYQSLLDVNKGNQPNLAASAAWWKQITRDGWTYVCPAPADMLDAIAVWNRPNAVSGVPLLGDPQGSQAQLVMRRPESDERQPFSVENADDGTDNKVILTDLDNPVLKYVKDVTNVVAMHPKFITTFAWHLAVPIAQWRGDIRKVQFCEAKAKETLGSAFIINERDQQEDPEPPSEFEMARTGRP